MRRLCKLASSADEENEKANLEAIRNSTLILFLNHTSYEVMLSMEKLKFHQISKGKMRGDIIPIYDITKLKKDREVFQSSYDEARRNFARLPTNQHLNVKIKLNCKGVSVSVGNLLSGNVDVILS
jgi:hypothetical protein